MYSLQVPLIPIQKSGTIPGMKKQIKNTLAVSSLLFSFQSFAAIDIPHLDGYDTANEAMWKDVKGDTVPNVLINRSSIDNPAASYSRLFPKSFLQDEMFAVCYQDCNKKDLIKNQNGSIQAGDKDSFEQANVYFWLNRYFNFLEDRFAFRPAKNLKVMTNRSIKDPTQGSKMKNNAFFNPADTTLSFLPASNSFLFNALKGKINRSGYDPSVISHEASHYFFQHLFPNAVNYEISGLNEGFADYIANLHMNNPKVGLIMLRGKALRDASSLTDGEGKMKTYSPGLEAHDLGERVATVLWLTREQADNKEEFDRHVVDSVKTIAQNPYAGVLSFKAEMMKRIPLVVSSDKMSTVNATWELLMAGTAPVISDKSFLSNHTQSAPYLGFKMSQTIAKRFADEMGIEEHNNQGFMFIREVQLPNKQTALLMASENAKIANPYWYVLDTASGNILGIYGVDERLVTDAAELKNIEDLTSQVANQLSTIKEFIEKTKMFGELAQGKGDLTSGYKIKSIQNIQDTILFNDVPTSVTRIEIALKKKFLLSLLVGLPDINQVNVYTADKNIAALPLLNGQRVIGYKLQFANGTAMEMILNKYNKAQ